MRILHILDHSIPLHSGYTFRTLAILKNQRVLGWETFHLTGPKQEGCTVVEEMLMACIFSERSRSRPCFLTCRGYHSLN